MTKEAIVRGAAKWLERNILPNLVPHGIMRMAFKGALTLANAAPDMAIGILSAKFPLLPTLVAAAGNDDVFDATVAAVKKAAEDEETVLIQFSEIGLFNNVPHSLALKPAHIDELYADIKGAAAAEKSGTPA